jgi:AraC family transcriptional regulator
MERPAQADYPAGAQLGPRTIDDFEFVWMLRGEARVTFDEGDLPLTRGHLLLVPPAVRHAFVWDQRRTSRHGYVHFEPRSGGRQLAAGELRIRPMTVDDPLTGLCAYLLWLGRTDDPRWQRSVGETLDLMVRLVLSGPLPPADPAPALPPGLAAAVDHVRREWSQLPLRRLGVSDLASAAHVSRGYLNRLFRSGVGLSANATLERLRISRAEALLTRTDSSIEGIATACGFADASHLSHRFSAIHNVSPRAYRAGGGQAPSVLDHPGVRLLSHLVWD